MKYAQMNNDQIAVLIDIKDAESEILAWCKKAAKRGELVTSAKFISCLKEAKKKQEKEERQQTKKERMQQQATVCRLLREWQGLTIEDFATECHASTATISRCENGKGSPGHTEFFLRKLCKRAGWSWPLFLKMVFDEDVDIAPVKQDAYT